MDSLAITHLKSNSADDYLEDSSKHPDERTIKLAIAKRFGQAAATYHRHAVIQRNGAKHLLSLIQSYQSQIPTGVVLEVGCGTGFITQGLIPLFSQRELEITDLSEAMLTFCQSQVFIPPQQRSFVRFMQKDGERISLSPQRYAAVISGFVIQWFQDPGQSLHHWLDQLEPGGFLFLSLLTSGSFPEWRQMCQQLDLPFTANPLPDPDHLLQEFTKSQIRHQQTVESTLTYGSAADFFRDLKAIGAGCSQTGQQLLPQQLKHLIQAWDRHTQGRVKVQFSILFLILQK